jgi:large subunit ribosomal protein L15
MLNIIKDNDGARRKYKRLGRGIGSGKGKTSARGGKGQTARSGVALNGFEGGQCPLYRRLPMRGFNNINRVEYTPINFEDLNSLAEAKKINPQDVTIASLYAAGFLKGKDLKLKLLGTGELKGKFNVEVHAVSKKAAEAFQKAGGNLKMLSLTKKVDITSEKPAKVKKTASKPAASKAAAPKTAKAAPVKPEKSEVTKTVKAASSKAKSPAAKTATKEKGKVKAKKTKE